MTSDERHNEKIKQLLRYAYFEKEKQGVGSHWQDQVMRTIRQTEAREPFFRLFEALVWRLSPAVGLLIICAAVGLMQIDFMPDAGIQQLLTYTVDDYDLSQFILL
jgi:hypothetical protein